MSILRGSSREFKKPCRNYGRKEWSVWLILEIQAAPFLFLGNPGYGGSSFSN
jgi:hypothetical protein